MQFTFTHEQETFRHEVRTFLDRELPAGWRERRDYDFADDEAWELGDRLRKKAAERNWLAMGWPTEYGGLGKSTIEQAIFAEEWAGAGAPGLNTQAIKMLGPTIMLHGTEEQKREYLPPIARGEVWWCQGYSEPDAGSDLASLETRAVEDGDDFVVNGSKIWTSGANRANHIFMLVRTDPDVPKHRGISFLVSRMDVPGLTMRPIYDANNDSQWNQLFFEDMRVPKRNLVGEKNRGWYVGAALLDFERSGIEYPAMASRMLQRLIHYVQNEHVNGRPLHENPVVKHLIAECCIECDVARLLAYRVAWMQSNGIVPNKEASMSKVFGSEMLQKIAATGMRIIGLKSQLIDNCKYAPVEGKFAYWTIHHIGRTIGAGTSEIQRDIIATRGLGLPRG
jgi:alkylation response protein AidB-like acyl-CoA dehydrogenase